MTTDVRAGAPAIDLLDPASFIGGQPHDQLAWLRENDPVHWHPEPDGPGFWAVTRYADVRTVSRDPSTYSSYRGGAMIPDPDPEQLAGSRLMMLYMDPPQHSRYRRLVVPGFTPRAAARWTERIHQLAGQIVDEVVERGECDLVADLAGEMPSYVIAELMGIPLEDGRRLYEWTETMHAARGTVPEEDQMAAIAGMLGYGAGIAAAKRADPGDDLASLLVNAEVDGDRLSDDDFNWFFLLLVNAGGDTTRNLVAGGVLALFDHPGERARLQADPAGLMGTAVEELLRWVSPVVHMRRTATADVELAGRPVAEGDKVVVFYGSANRDAAVFVDPDRMDLARNPNEHVAFGAGGPHFCLGAHIARLETSALLGEVLTRLPDLEPAGEPSWLPSNFVSGPASMPVRFTPGARRPS